MKRLILAAALVLVTALAAYADPTEGTIWVWEVAPGSSKTTWINHYDYCLTTWSGAHDGKVRCSLGTPGGNEGSPYQSAPVSILD